VTTNVAGITTNATGITTNTANITSNTNTITTNGTGISSLDTRFTQLENGQASSVPVNCAADSTAFLNTLIIDNTNYVLTGICDGPIFIRGRRNVAILGDGVGGPKDDGITGVVGGESPLVISFSTDIVLDDLAITALDQGSVISAENNSSIEVSNTNLSGGGAGIVVSSNSLVRILPGVSVSDFIGIGAYATSGGLLKIDGPTSFSGSSTAINGLTNGLQATNNGTIILSGLANGTVITPTMSLIDEISTITGATNALSVGDGGSILVKGTATFNGGLNAGSSGSIQIISTVDINGNLRSSSSASLSIGGGASTITGNISVSDGGHMHISNATIDGGSAIALSNNGVLVLGNTTLIGSSIDVGSGSRLRLGASISFTNSDFLIRGGAGVVIEGASITGSGVGIVISRYGTLTLQGPNSLIDMNNTNITCDDAAGYLDSSFGVSPINIGIVTCP